MFGQAARTASLSGPTSALQRAIRAPRNGIRPPFNYSMPSHTYEGYPPPTPPFTYHLPHRNTITASIAFPPSGSHLTRTIFFRGLHA